MVLLIKSVGDSNKIAGHGQYFVMHRFTRVSPGFRSSACGALQQSSQSLSLPLVAVVQQGFFEVAN